MDNEPEVLVHISTPATRSNDDLYRSLAESYLSFEPYQAQETLRGEEVPQGSTSNRSMPLSPSQRPADSDIIAVNAIPSMDSYGSFPSQVASNTSSSGLEDPKDLEFSDSLGEAVTSRIERLERIQTKWKEQRTPKSSLANNRRQSTSVSILATEETTFIEDTQLAYQAVESQLMGQLSATSEDTSDDEADNDCDRTHLMPATGNVRNESQTVPCIDQEQSTISKSMHTVVSQKTAAESLEPISVASGTTRRVSRQPGYEELLSQQVNFRDLPFEVSPPPPTVTIEAPGNLPSQVTKYLRTLKQQNPGRFKPKTTLRALEHDERGHWAVRCGSWPRRVQHEFWSSVQDDVSNGRLGWGVTLHREPAHSRELGLVRLYCWGEVVEHAWLSLWLSSGGKLCGTGSIWIDSEELEVITIA